MRRAQLEHTIRTACQIIQQPEVFVVGSQAILRTYDESQLPAAQCSMSTGPVLKGRSDAFGDVPCNLDNREAPGGPVTRTDDNCFVMRFEGEAHCRDFTECYLRRPQT